MAPLRSIRVRLTLWYVLLLAVILGVFSAGVYFALRTSLYSNLDDSLDSKAQTLGAAVALDGEVPTLSSDSAPGDPQGEQFTRVFDTSGEITFDNAPEAASVPVDRSAIEAAVQGRTARGAVHTADEDFRVLTTPVYRDGAIVGALQVAQTKGDVHDTLRILLLIIAVAYPFTLVVASAGGVFLAGRALAPIDDLTRLARRLSAEDLSQRLDAKLPDDEVGRLAQTFSDMIARLDDAFRRQRQFTADASHELRTPLTAIKGQTEVALQRDRPAEDYREVLRTVNAEVDRMIRLVSSLLSLARADSAEVPIAEEQVDLGRLLDDAVEQLTPAAVAKGIDLQARPGPEIRLVGDEDLLLQLVLNLLDNAVKHTSRHESVKVSRGVEDGCVVIRVSDTGPGIAQEHLSRIFDRFYRVDKARGGANGGAGLGLSISRWIAEAHGGTLTAESTPGRGSTFTVKLPLSRNSS